MIAVIHTYSDITVEFMQYHGFPSATKVQVHAGGDRLLYLDGSPAEAFQEVLRGQHGTVNDEAGPKQRRCSFSSGRRLPVGVARAYRYTPSDGLRPSTGTRTHLSRKFEESPR
jgi:hypothetical protein